MSKALFQSVFGYFAYSQTRHVESMFDEDRHITVLAKAGTTRSPILRRCAIEIVCRRRIACVQPSGTVDEAASSVTSGVVTSCTHHVYIQAPALPRNLFHLAAAHVRARAGRLHALRRVAHHLQPRRLCQLLQLQQRVLSHTHTHTHTRTQTSGGERGNRISCDAGT